MTSFAILAGIIAYALFLLCVHALCRMAKPSHQPSTDLPEADGGEGSLVTTHVGVDTV